MPIPELSGVPVLVTGGAGFIGSHLVDALLEHGALVRVMDNLATGRLTNLARWFPEAHGVTATQEMDSPVAPLTFHRGDIRDPQDCRRACDGCVLVFHLAALGSVPRSLEDPVTTIAVNVAGTANVFDAARRAGVRRIVYASSSSVYGDSDRLPKREGEEGRPLSPYAWSKAANEHLADIFGRCYGMELVGLRYFNVYGPRQDPAGPYAAVIPRFIAACLAGEPPVIHGDGGQSRDFTYVSDAVKANLLAAGASSSGVVVNVAAGARTTIAEVAGAVQAAVGSGRDPVHTEPRAGDVRHSLASLDRAATALEYAPIVVLRDGVGKSVAWFRQPAAKSFHPGAGEWAPPGEAN